MFQQKIPFTGLNWVMTGTIHILLKDFPNLWESRNICRILRIFWCFFQTSWVWTCPTNIHNYLSFRKDKRTILSNFVQFCLKLAELYRVWRIIVISLLSPHPTFLKRKQAQTRHIRIVIIFALRLSFLWYLSNDRII